MEEEVPAIAESMFLDFCDTPIQSPCTSVRVLPLSYLRSHLEEIFNHAGKIYFYLMSTSETISTIATLESGKIVELLISRLVH